MEPRAIALFLFTLHFFVFISTCSSSCTVQDVLLQLPADFKGVSGVIGIDSISEESMYQYSFLPFAFQSIGHLSKEQKINFLDDNTSSTALILGMTNPDSEFLAAVSKTNLLRRHFWLLPESHILSSIPVKALRLDTKLFTFQCDGHLGVKFKEIYSILQRKTVIRDINKWTPKLLLDRRSDLNGVTLVNSVLRYDKITNIIEDSHGRRHYSGYLTDIIESLALVMNFQLKWISPKDGTWGLPDANGTWTGIVRDLMDSTADISTAGLTTLDSRSAVIDFSIDMFEDIVAPIMKRRTTQSNNINIRAYINVFYRPTWIIIFISIALLALSFLILSVHQDFRQDGKRFGIGSSFAVVVIAMFQKEYHALNIQKHSSNLLFSVTCFFGFFIFSVYSAALTSLMTIRPQATPIDSLLELVEQNMEVFGFEGSASIGFLQNAPLGSDQQLLLQKMKETPETMFVKDHNEARARLISNEKAVLYSFALAYTKKPEFMIVPLANSLKSFQAIGFQKDSELVDLFNNNLKKLNEIGVMKKLQLQWIEDDQDLTDEAPEEAVSLGYESVLFPFSIVLAGLALSIVGIFLERVAKGRAGST